MKNCKPYKCMKLLMSNLPCEVQLSNKLKSSKYAPFQNIENYIHSKQYLHLPYY